MRAKKINEMFMRESGNWPHSYGNIAALRFNGAWGTLRNKCVGVLGWTVNDQESSKTRYRVFCLWGFPGDLCNISHSYLKSARKRSRVHPPCFGVGLFFFFPKEQLSNTWALLTSLNVTADVSSLNKWLQEISLLGWLEFLCWISSI